MAKITYTDKETLNEIPSIPAKNKVQAADMNEIKNVVNQNELKILLIADSSAPAECSTGDMYYNTTTKLIYTATGTNTWGSTGVNPTQSTLYIDSTNKSTYFYDGSDLISVGGGAGGESLKIGTIVPFAGSTIPDGYLTCDGTAVSRTTYSDLFAVIGTTYGTGDGSTTFNLPNLKGRVPVGLDGTDTDFDTIGETGGEKTHTLTIAEIPSHRHQLPIIPVNNARSEQPYASDGHMIVQKSAFDRYSDYEGGGQAHNNLQPYIVTNFIIKATKTTPVQAEIVNGYSTSTTDGYSCNEANTLFQTKGQVLWTNANPTSAFAEQTINLDMSDYNFIEIYYRFYTGATGEQIATKIPVGSSAKFINEVWLEGIGETIAMRTVHTSSNNIVFTNTSVVALSDGTLRTTNLANGTMIPTKVIGYKTGLFS